MKQKEVAFMQLISLNIGMPKALEYQGKLLESGIFKEPVEGPLLLSSLQLEGDGQADLVNHGGPDKAVCVYALEHFAYWEERLGKKLSHGAFGENFTVRGMTEETVHLGDIFEVGGAIVQVSQPRQPCFKLGKKHEAPDLPLQVQTSGFTGYYFRVLQEGEVQAGEAFRLVQKDPAGVSIAEANRVKYRDKQDKIAIRRILAVAALSESWRGSFERRLLELEGSPDQ